MRPRFFYDFRYAETTSYFVINLNQPPFRYSIGPTPLLTHISPLLNKGENDYNYFLPLFQFVIP